MNRMAHRREHHAAAAKIIRPAGNRLGPQILVGQAIDVLGFQQNVFLVLVIVNIVLFVVDNKVAHSLSDRVLIPRRLHPERPERRMSNVCAPHHLPIVLRGERDVAAVVERIKSIAGSHEILDRRALIFCHPHCRFRISGPSWKILQVPLVVRVGVGTEIPVWPDHSVTKAKK